MSSTSKYKLVMLGDSTVGKTSIITRFISDKFDHSQTATIGIDFLSKTVYLQDRLLRLQLWDTAGQERFRSLIPSYIRDSAVAIVAYDITNKISFDNIEKWIYDIRKQRGNDIIILLVANKIDLNKKRQITPQQGQNKAHELGVLFVEVSAKNGQNIKQIFTIIAQHLPDHETQIKYIENEVIFETESTPKSVSACWC